MPPKVKELSQPVVNDAGEKVIAATRRPDGTLRKERRVRDGYTPQEEQPVYQSKAILVRQNVPVCPGMDPADLAAAKVSAASKAAKKNEKRKEKKVGEVAPVLASSAAGSGSAPKVSPAQPTQAAAEAASAANTDTPEQALSKQIRALNKKLRQAEALAAKAGAGASLTPEEADKASKIETWTCEVEQLQKQLDALKVV